MSEPTRLASLVYEKNMYAGLWEQFSQLYRQKRASGNRVPIEQTAEEWERQFNDWMNKKQPP